MANRHVDVLIVGAGISGIDAACHLTRDLPGRSYRILERRHDVGGTWDLFRFPGVRSDSDMYTYGYRFRPWLGTQVLADGASIRRYLDDTIDAYGVRDHITFGRKVDQAAWSTDEGRWTVEALDEATGERERWTCTFLVICTGYFDYDAGYRPAFPGEQNFDGPIVHPQHWPQDLDHAGKRVVVVGSGATAVTLVPALAGQAAHVTMLQRSPSYVVSLPAEDKVSQTLNRILPTTVVYRLARLRNEAVQRAMYAVAQRYPDRARELIAAGVRRHLGPDGDLTAFDPKYNPWDQRLCIVPDGDLFAAVRTGTADIVTGTIETFTPTGIRLADGRDLAADIIVTATGLRVQVMGGMRLSVDGTPIALNEKLVYKAVLVEDVPNVAWVFGYTNASWTLKADLACEYVVRLLRHMDRHGYTQVVARAGAAEHDTGSVMSSLTSGYVRRANAYLPRQGRHGPWVVRNNYFHDARLLRRAPIADDALLFSTGVPRPMVAMAAV